MDNLPETFGFYNDGEGDRLVDEAHYPDAIKQFLILEAHILNTLVADFDLLVEAGCMNGRYLDWAVLNHKRYLGVDPVARYINAAKRDILLQGLDAHDYQAVVGRIEQLASLIEITDTPSPKKRGLIDLKSQPLPAYRPNPQNPRLISAVSRGLVFFPFNSLGNMISAERVLAMLSVCDFDILISSYQTDVNATALRMCYYTQCGYDGLTISENAEGVRITSNQGLNTIAYHPQFLEALMTQYGYHTASNTFGDIGLAYVGRRDRDRAAKNSCSLRRP